MGNVNENAIAKESELYTRLLTEYNNGGDSKTNFFKCVNIAREADKDEVHFILYKLKYLNEDVDSGIEKANILYRVIKFFAGDSLQSAFMIAVLETALDK